MVLTQPYRPDRLHWQVFRGSTAIGKGLLSRHQLRSGAWRRLFRDVYADARLPRSHAVNCRGALLLAPEGAAVSGRSAAVLHGVPFAATAGEPVELTVPPGVGFGPVRGVTVRRRSLGEDALVRLDGLPVTRGGRTAWDVGCRLDPIDAVVILDGLLAAGAVAPGELELLAREARGERGWRRASAAFRLADGRAQSPPESVLRVRLVTAGLPPPVPQFAVAAGLGVLLHPDLAWPDQRVGLDYDDALHRGPARPLDPLTALGWIVLQAGRRHLGTGFDHLVDEVRSALRARGWPG